jgi:antirestriction protein ArdC
MQTVTNRAAPTDVYGAITARIVTAIEQGAGEFQMPWHGQGAAITRPQNAFTKMDYRGINVVALWVEASLSGYDSGYWASYRQWQRAGAQVRAGERGATIVFFKRIETSDENGEPAERLVARASRVFNANQVRGWQPPADRMSPSGATLTERVEAFAKGTGADIRFGGEHACYHIREDYIEMPDSDRFIGSSTSSPSETLASTLLHELVHYSGAAGRLDRGFGETWSREALAFEELIAELGAAFLCADLGVTNEPRADHAAYVASWLSAMRDDKRAIFQAARQAQQTVQYLQELPGQGSS